MKFNSQKTYGKNGQYEDDGNKYDCAKDNEYADA